MQAFVSSGCVEREAVAADHCFRPGLPRAANRGWDGVQSIGLTNRLRAAPYSGMGEHRSPHPAQQNLLDTVRLQLVGRAEVARWAERIPCAPLLHNASLYLNKRDAHRGRTASRGERRRSSGMENSRFRLLPGVACPKNRASRLHRLAAQRVR